MTTDPGRPTPPDARSRPRLAAGVRLQSDRLGGEPVLLFPEGLLKLNATGAAIVGLCDGHRSAAEVVAALAAKFDAPPDVLGADVAEYLGRLERRRLVCFDPPASTDDPPRGLPGDGGPDA